MNARKIEHAILAAIATAILIQARPAALGAVAGCKPWSPLATVEDDVVLNSECVRFVLNNSPAHLTVVFDESVPQAGTMMGPGWYVVPANFPDTLVVSTDRTTVTLKDVLREDIYVRADSAATFWRQIPFRGRTISLSGDEWTLNDDTDQRTATYRNSSEQQGTAWLSREWKLDGGADRPIETEVVTYTRNPDGTLTTASGSDNTSVTFSASANIRYVGAIAVAHQLGTAAPGEIWRPTLSENGNMSELNRDNCSAVTQWQFAYDATGAITMNSQQDGRSTSKTRWVRASESPEVSGIRVSIDGITTALTVSYAKNESGGITSATIEGRSDGDRTWDLDSLGRSLKIVDGSGRLLLSEASYWQSSTLPVTRNTVSENLSYTYTSDGAL